MTSERYYVTTPIYYVNDKPHIGHAYSTLAADVVARFNRLDGREVMFLTGTDEHGQKVQKSAFAKGMDPQTFTDQVSQNFRDLAAAMNYSINDFIRTTERRHHIAAQAIWKTMVEAGDIYEGAYEGWYSVRDEAFYDEKELTEQDGRKLAPTGAEVEWVSEPSYFFRLSQWGDRLLEFYAANPDFILPASRRNEVISFVKGGLQDLSISRTTFDWGIQVPGDDRHIMYVWLDALTNYITAIGYPDQEAESFKAFWPANLHIVGKDILRFHAVYWPAFLMSAGMAPPHRVFAHGWLLNRGQKMSKSLGNVLDPYDLKDKYGLDQTRYFLLREVPFGNDGYVSHDAVVQRINSDLANDLGNLAQRSLSMIAKNCDGKIPAPGAFIEADDKLLGDAAALEGILREQLAIPAFHRALEAVWQVIGDANRYIDEQAPWALKKTDPERMGTVLYVIAESLRCIGLLLQPVMPDAMARLLDVLSVQEEDRTFKSLNKKLKAGTELPKPTPIFPRYLEDEPSMDAQADADR